MNAANPMQSMMEEGIKDAFGSAFDHAVQPILVRLTELEGAINTLISQQTELLDVVRAVKAKGGMVGKLLGG